jgi:hypothetical protein
MTDHSPRRATNCVRQYADDEVQLTDPNEVLPWAVAVERLAAASLYWLTAIRPDGHPHVRPVFAVWSGGSLYSTTSSTARKTAFVAHDPRCVLTASTDGLDIVYDALATRVTDAATLEQVAEVYREKYGWPVQPVDAAFHAPFGAPSAGPPPYLLFRYDPITVHGLGTADDTYSRSTRWDFT